MQMFVTWCDGVCWRVTVCMLVCACVSRGMYGYAASMWLCVCEPVYVGIGMWMCVCLCVLVFRCAC